MKVVINSCYGGFGISARAMKRLCELKGRPCFFFQRDVLTEHGFDKAPYEPISVEEADNPNTWMWYAFDIPNPDDIVTTPKDWHSLTKEQQAERNALYEKHSIESGRDLDRHDPLLVQVVEELGGSHKTGASAKFASLTIVEIPDGVDYIIEEHDGNEHIAERHRTWG